MMNDRHLSKCFLPAVIFSAFVVFISALSCQRSEPGLFMMTVNGPVPLSEIGAVLVHEHILVDFSGADQAGGHRYDQDKVFRVALPFLREARESGCRTFIECTPPYMARDPLLLKRLSAEAGLHILVSTGYYGARNNKYIPGPLLAENEDRLAERMIGEWKAGIENTGIKPGLIKIGVDPGTLSEAQQRIVRAAARAHLQTGLTIASHTGPAAGAFEQIEILRSEGVDPSAWVWVHAQSEKDAQNHIKAARTGAWVSFDGLRENNIALYVELLSNMKAAGLLHRVLVSHDAGYYRAGEPGGGEFIGYTTLFKRLSPELTARGYSQVEIEQLTERNPQQAFALRVRRKGSL